MEQSNNTERQGTVVCLKIKMGEQAYYIPIDKIENVRINPELVKVPEAPDGIAGLLLGDRGHVPYIVVEECQSGENKPDWKCGVEIKNGNDSLLGILCTDVEENIAVAPEVLAEQAALWRSGEN